MGNRIIKSKGELIFLSDQEIVVRNRNCVRKNMDMAMKYPKNRLYSYYSLLWVSRRDSSYVRGDRKTGLICRSNLIPICFCNLIQNYYNFFKWRIVRSSIFCWWENRNNYKRKDFFIINYHLRVRRTRSKGKLRQQNQSEELMSDSGFYHLLILV